MLAVLACAPYVLVRVPEWAPCTSFGGREMHWLQTQRDPLLRAKRSMGAPTCAFSLVLCVTSTAGAFRGRVGCRPGGEIQERAEERAKGVC